MRVWRGNRIDDGTTAVFAYDEHPEPKVEEVGDLLAELRALNDDPDAHLARQLEFVNRKRDLIERIEASTAVPQVRAVHPPNPTRRFDWGTDGSVMGGLDLARAILHDAVGDPPPDEVVARHAREVIDGLPQDGFRLDAADVNEFLLTRGLVVEAELAAHRWGLDPNRATLRILTPEEADGAGPVPGSQVAATDPATASALVAACEQAWADIQRLHPDVPHAVVVLASGVERGRLVKLGHWWGGRWLADGEVRGEVLLAGEALHLPAEQVFEVLLHEAAHGINAAHDVKDASRGGRYHNRRFRATAELVGLDVSVMPPYGWARTNLTAETVERYRDSIDRLGDAMRIAPAVDGPKAGEAGQEAGAGADGTPRRGRTDETGPRNPGSAMCGCGRRLRMAPSVLAAGPVLCGLCGNEFQMGRQTTKVAGHSEAEPRGDTVVNRSFLHRRRGILAGQDGGDGIPGRSPARVAAFVAAAREAGYGAHPAVLTLSHHHRLPSPSADSGMELHIPALTDTQLAGLVELVGGGDKPGDWAVASWYPALGTGAEHAMAAGNLSEAARRRTLARAMLKADGTLHGPPVDVLGREFLAGEQINSGPIGIRSLDLDAGVPGTVECVDPDGRWLDVDFPTAGRYRLAVDGPEAATLAYAYTEVAHGADRVDLRSVELDLRPPVVEPLVPAEAALPEINL